MDVHADSLGGAHGSQEQAHLAPAASAALQQGPVTSTVTGHPGTAAGTASHLVRGPLQLQRRSEPCRCHRSDMMAALTTGAARPPRFPCTGCRLRPYTLRCDFQPRLRRPSAAIRTPRALGGLARRSAHCLVVTGPTCMFRHQINRSREAELDQLASAILAG
ncbi:hypothetical protein NDU88_000090 [Pleurodeles waltl]|uniref:Uncharacterized protein n=1 Tax=Pleurodeles waltl TaxID=8319 RepID=A0AAV7UQ33_PLEWA|nr:hypothetical protein NDU88_000090 [Pleurodeles waltl]